MTSVKINDLSLEIKNIFDDNELNDLKRFINKRKCLNLSNSYLIYLFHIVQSAGVLTTTIAAGYNDKLLIWFGVGLNILASLINIFQQTNNNISKKLMRDIQSIRDRKYVGESLTVENDVVPNGNNNSSVRVSSNPQNSEFINNHSLNNIPFISKINPPVTPTSISEPSTLIMLQNDNTSSSTLI